MTTIQQVYRRIHGRRIRLLPREIRQRLRGISVVNQAGFRIYIDPSDGRGRDLFARGGVVDRDAVRIWGEIIERLQPSIVLDVGANYGEVALSRRYPPDSRLEFIEANPRISRVLQKTLDSIPNSRVHNCAAGESVGVVSLHRMGAASSGRSSISHFAEAEDAIRVAMMPVDKIVDARFGDRLCFKIDVEGAEVSVIKGMSGLLEKCEWLGMLEYPHLSKLDMSWLREKFLLSAVHMDSLELIPFSWKYYEDSRARESMQVAKDLVVQSR